MTISRVAIALFASFQSFASAQYQAPSAQEVNRYSLEKEAALGSQLAAEMRQRTTPIENATVQDYVDRLIRRLTAKMPHANFPFTSSVIAEDPCPAVHEPAALPGGYIFVPAALFLAAQDEAELAGMLAHAMAHIAERHGIRQRTSGELFPWGKVPLIFLGGAGGYCADDAALPRGLLTAQRAYEREADVLAVRIMAKAGFDPNALVRYIERVQAQPSTTRSAASSALPPREDRLAAMSSVIAELPAGNHAGERPGEFATVRQAVRRLVPANRPTPPPSLRR